MFFTLLTFASALFIEGLGSLVSVIGISALFGANPIIIALAISLDVGKIVVVSLLYTYWKQLSILMRSYALVAAAVTMVITSAGAAGYLSGEFQKAIIGTKEGEQKVAVLKEQMGRYQERKKQIDDQIANLPERTTVNQRLRLIRGFDAEQKRLDAQIAAIDKELPAAQIAQIGTEAKAGPILYVARAFDIPVEKAVTWVIGLIIFVFDPLAIFLIIAGNFLWAHHKKGDKPHLDMWEDDLEPEVVPKAEAIKPTARQAMYEDRDWSPTPEQSAENIETNKEFYDKLLAKQQRPFDKYDDESAVNNVYVREDGTVIRPVMPPIFEVLQPTPRQEPVKVDEPKFEDPPASIPILPEPEPTPGIAEPTFQSSMLNHVEAQPLKFDEPEPTVDAIPTGKVIPKREEITRSTLGLTPPDPSTIVDAQRDSGFQRAKALVPPKGQ